MLPLESFIDYIKKNALFNKDDKILLAVSGGKDSALMVQLFKLSGFKFSIAHCNFNLRAGESQRDEAFVRLLAADLDVPFYVNHFDTAAYAKEHRISIQMAARDLRYQWFETVRKENGYAYIALGHHQNDSIETLLLNLTRGTGISGMHGILPKRDRLVRPLLFLTRFEIDEYVEKNHIACVEDSSNEYSKYARNKIRLNVIPQLRDINPNLEDTFATNIARFVETEEVLHKVVEDLRSRICRKKNEDTYISISEIHQLQPQKLLFFELLKPYHFSAAIIIETLSSLNKQSGTSFYSPTYRLTIDRDQLIISTNKQNSKGHYLMHPHDDGINVGKQKITLHYPESHQIVSDPDKAYIDSDLLIFPIIIRFKQDGDKFIPLGMKRHKKLSDFLIDKKIPIPQKEKIPILINGNGEIIWVCGLRQDNRYKVTSTTKKVAIFELSNQ